MRARWLARALRPGLLALAAARPPDFQVTRDGGRDVYLRRWWVIPRNNYFNIYLHNMLKDDDDVLHDHMYASLSLVLTDGLFEHYRETPPHGILRMRWPREGNLVWRSSRMAHQLRVERPAWTLFVTGPRIKEWGFWCPEGFRHWRDYLGEGQDPSVRGNGLPGTVSRVGRGCGEQS